MPSPFPGMNPYLEQKDTWEDFHQSFMTHARDLLAAGVGENYLVKIEVRLYIHEVSEDERRFMGRADVGVSAAGPAATRAAAGAAILEAPMELWLPETDTERQSYLEIHDRRERRVVTALELLSPTNKTPGDDYNAYVSKRRSLLKSRTNFVEIDLRRGGVRPQPPELPACDYYVLVSRYQERPKVGLWPVGLRDRLPEIPIPLTAPDPDIHLDLQALLNTVYDRAGYGKYIYAENPEPPLVPADSQWARQFLPQKP
jgi:hypothetical protein